MKKNFCILFLVLVFITISLIFARNNEALQVKRVITPTDIVLDKQEFTIDRFDCFDPGFSPKNKQLAKDMSISEEEAFILGNLGKYWAAGMLEGRFVYIKDNSDLIYFRTSYEGKFKNSGFCFKNGQPCNKSRFDEQLNLIRKTKYNVLDLDSDKVYEISSPETRNLKNFLVIKKIHLPRHLLKQKKAVKQMKAPAVTINSGKIRIYLTDSTTKIKPDRSCDSSICREILNNINNSKSSIDMAIYGYSRVPAIENALSAALKRGVKIRLIYDSDSSGKNIYPDSDVIKNLLQNNMSDINSAEANNIMHNKFYIFDDKILITGSANLAHTDMSGFNSNSAAVIESEDAAKIYKQEFEQMFSGKFHNDKIAIPTKNVNLSDTNLSIYFSPKDKSIANAVIPIINKAEKYIYIPTFVLTDKKVTSALIEAKNRGVDVRIIIDALNASVQHSKHRELRSGGILVKTENYAGKMHSKSMIIDDKYAIIGSMNFSNSGENKNDENLIVITDTTIAKAYKEFFLYQWSRIDDKWLKFNARAEGKDSMGSCSDGLDNNYDGLTDLDDPACRQG